MRIPVLALVPVLLLAASLGCNRSPGPVEKTIKDSEETLSEAAKILAASAATPASANLWNADEDLDGDGKPEKIAVDIGHEVKIGSAVVPFPEGMEEPVTVEVIDIDKKA